MISAIRKIADKDRIKVVIRIVGLDPESKKHVGKYSLGMRQRLAITQSIMEDSELIILDEPLNGLDNDGVKEIRLLFIALKNEEKLILLCSHNPKTLEFWQMICRGWIREY